MLLLKLIKFKSYHSDVLFQIHQSSFQDAMEHSLAEHMTNLPNLDTRERLEAITVGFLRFRLSINFIFIPYKEKFTFFNQFSFFP